MSITSSIPKTTYSVEGLNVRSALRPLSHFFLEDGGNPISQTINQSFGPLSTSQFRTTSKMTFSGAKKVYAICQGQLFIQPNSSDGTKVNVVLRPYRQPIKGVSIKYFIYRGLNKIDFFTSSGTPILAGSETSGTELNQYLWRHFNAFYSQENSSLSTPLFLPEFLGFPSGNLVQNATDFIDDFFFKKTEYTDLTNTVELASSSFELPIVQRGFELGTASGEMGIDVVLNNGDYRENGSSIPFAFDLEFARSGDHILDVSTSSNLYEEKLTREMVFNFIDIVAFYGMHATGAGKLYVDSITTPFESKANIYSKLSNFHTKNTQYLYVRGSRGRSYNFYGEHKHSDNTNLNNMSVGTDSANLSESVYGTFEWPIHILNNQTSLSIQLIFNNYKKAGMYVETGKIISENTNNFLNVDNLLQDSRTAPIITHEIYSKPIDFLFEEESGAAISSFLDIVYDGVLIPVDQPVDSEVYLLKGIDNLFGEINAIPSIAGDTESLPTVVEENLQITSFVNYNRQAIKAAVKVKRVTDKIQSGNGSFSSRVTFETLLDAIEYNANRLRQVTASTVENVSSKLIYHDNVSNNFYELDDPYYLELKSFYNGAELIKGLVVNHIEGALPAKKMLGITAIENQLIKDLATSTNLTNSRLFFKNVLGNETDFFISPEHIRYRVYRLGLAGESTDGTLKLHMPSALIEIYTLDDLAYFSKEYSQNIQVSQDLEIINNIKPELP